MERGSDADHFQAHTERWKRASADLSSTEVQEPAEHIR
jgi:hypothetical protein